MKKNFAKMSKRELLKLVENSRPLEIPVSSMSQEGIQEEISYWATAIIGGPRTQKNIDRRLVDLNAGMQSK